MRRFSVAARWLWIFVVVGAAGCAHDAGSSGGTGSSVPPSPSLASTENSTSGTYANQPGATILFVYADSSHRAIIQNATEAAIAACMRSAGFRYEPIVRTDTSATDYLLLVDQSWGVFDRNVAARYGYGQPDEEPSPGGGATSNDPAYIAALFGPDGNQSITQNVTDPITGQIVGTMTVRGGCVGDADNAVFGDPEVRNRYYALDLSIQSLAIDAITRARSSIPTLAALDAWSGCMKSKGYEYSDPMQPLSKDWSDPPTEEELTTALADFDCKMTARLTETFRQEVANAAAVAADEHRQQVSDWTSLQAEIERRLRPNS